MKFVLSAAAVLVAFASVYAELFTTAVTLQRLATVAVQNQNATAVSAYVHAYQHVRAEVMSATVSASLKTADDRMRDLATRNLVTVEATHTDCAITSSDYRFNGLFNNKPRVPGFTQLPGVDLGGLLNDSTISGTGR
jgi:hypothetical protein